MRTTESGAMRVTLVLALLLGGCVNPAYRDTVGQFGAITKASVAAQDARLTALGAVETERVHAALATDRVDLRLSPACAQRLALQGTGAATDGPPAAPCTLVARGGGAIEAAPKFSQIRALAQGLSDYADALIALAADTTEDRAAFADSVNGVGTALGNLDGAVRSATGVRAAQSRAALGAVAGVIGRAGGLLLAAERVATLKRIILAGDPVVQRSVAVLTDVDDRLGLYDLSGLGLALQNAQQNATRLAANGAPPEELRPAQDALFAALNAYNAAGADQAHYAAIGVAHARLAAAARRGASAAELQSAILAVLDLAAETQAAAKTVATDPEWRGGEARDNQADAARRPK